MERRRQRDSSPPTAWLRVVRADPVRREQRDRNWLVVPDEISLAVMLPVDAEAGAVRTPLPGDRVSEMEPACAIVARRRVSNQQTGLRNVDRRRAKSETSRTILSSSGTHAGSDRRTKTGGRSPASGGGRSSAQPDSGPPGPRRGSSWKDMRLAIHRRLPRRVQRPGCHRASGGRRWVCAIDFRVEPNAEEIARQRARRDSAQVSEVRRQQRRGGNRPLIVALPVTKVENAVPRMGPPTAKPNCCRWKNGSGLFGSRWRAG